MSSLKDALSEAMKENGDWMTRMKKDHEVQLRTQKDMVSMYRKKNKKLEEENEKLKESKMTDFQIKMMKKKMNKLEEVVEAYESLTGIGRDVVCRHNDPDDDDYYTYKTFEEYEEEIGENDEDKTIIPDGVVRAFKGLVVNWWEDEEKYYSENFDMKEKYDGDPGNIPTKYLSDCNYTDLRILNDWIVGGKYEKYEIEESSSEEEEESSSEEEEEYTIEINVVGLGWCRYIDEEDRDKHVVYCKNGLWKMKGDKTAKDCEGNYCETDDEE